MKETIGGCLVAMGMLIAGATGLCMWMFFTGSNKWQQFKEAFGFLGAPFLIGLVLIIFGSVLIASGRKDRN